MYVEVENSYWIVHPGVNSQMSELYAGTTGSLSNDLNFGVTCDFSDRSKMQSPAAFRFFQRGLTAHVGNPVYRELQISRWEAAQGVQRVEDVFLQPSRDVCRLHSNSRNADDNQNIWFRWRRKKAQEQWELESWIQSTSLANDTMGIVHIHLVD